LKINLKVKSIRFRIWLYFLGFTALVLALMWFLQIFFLNNYYEEMKVRETKNAAYRIATAYDSGGEESMIEIASDISMDDDMYIHIETADGTLIYASNLRSDYEDAISAVKEDLYASGDTNVSGHIPNEENNRNTLAFARFLGSDKKQILYVFSPLYPVQSTINILKSQLTYITLIAFFLAFVLAYFLSIRITDPLLSIIKSARKLSEGQYGISFRAERPFAEIEDLASTLNKTSLELERSVNMQKDLIANMSHDLRTPLTMVKSYAEMIRDLSGDDPRKRTEHLNVIIDEADRLNQLVGDILTMSAIQSGKLPLEETTFDMKETVESVLAPYRILEENEGYTFDVHCRDRIYVRGDHGKITQVLSNLVTNAIKYCGSDKRVIITVRKINKIMRCEVSDNGAGIKPEELPYIWKRYYKSSSNHIRATAGTGLGLSIVNEILTLHNTPFGVKSSLGKGTTFWFELDAARRH
jgi:signal transduction histidine kinase